MKVRKTSWHYRLWKWGRENERSQPRDLCRYFWHLAIVKVLLPLTALGFCMLGVGYLAYVIWGHPRQTLSVIVGGAVVAALMFAVYKLSQRVDAKRVQERLHPEPKKDPSPLREYLAARKRKVCPLIEVEE